MSFNLHVFKIMPILSGQFKGLIINEIIADKETGIILSCNNPEKNPYSEADTCV